MFPSRKKRTEFDIEHDILSACKNGIRKTALMDKANLSYELAKKYISSLSRRGFIRFDGTLYYITESGLKRLEDLEEYQKRRSEFEAICEKLRSASRDTREENTTKKEGHRFLGRSKEKKGRHT
ncbi:winged helix-turn-helix domain-containing protein [Sulfuracidifex metallicus]|uniref:winged helix-turn-helix domain-containing protein n=1 Tax=Sulfuracidifex metallicus TaxID=47303 RepID=UPI0022742276|nr:winged helix-turn-helix domain-containing protein [Sulfuracidifex metallicus]MCY0849751.1 hypothetical protein [Sulfuracidifex metallicus]